MKTPSQRQLRVAEQIRSVLSGAMHRGHFSDEVLLRHAMDITIGGVDAAPDLKSAKIFVTCLDQDDVLPVILSALNANRHYFQSEINHQLNLKFTPKLHFKEDETVAEAQRIDALLKTLKTLKT